MKLIMIALIVFSALVQAKSLEGFEVTPSARRLPLKGIIVSVEETKDAFLIELRMHPAMYTFPKSVASANLRKELDKVITDRTIITLEYDAETAQIFKLNLPD